MALYNYSAAFRMVSNKLEYKKGALKQFANIFAHMCRLTLLIIRLPITSQDLSFDTKYSQSQPREALPLSTVISKQLLKGSVSRD